jgi:poly-gamma-glutamate synthesis protein (capsule biosynthesis protein)
MKDSKSQIILFLVSILTIASVVYITYTLSNPRTIRSPMSSFSAVQVPVVETKLFFAGDIMLSRNVGTKMVEANDVTLPYKDVAATIKSADISFANLESPFNDKGGRVTQGLTFKAEPNTVDGLTFAGFDILATANNHVFDQGKTGITYTLDWLNQHGIKSVGVGLDCHSGVVMEADGMKFGYLAYSYTAFNDGGKSTDPLVCNWNDQKQIAADIKALKPKVDFLIVTSHMGTEYKRVPDEANAIGARATIDAGADLFVGHHPHWVQTIEEYNGKYIFYSLGNFVFDQMWSQDTKEGLAFEVLFKDKKLSRISLLPVVIENFCCPHWATEEETKNILTKINPQYSSKNLMLDGKTSTDWQAAVGSQLDKTTPLD